jgi:hypothetical protein
MIKKNPFFWAKICKYFGPFRTMANREISNKFDKEVLGIEHAENYEQEKKTRSIFPN